MSVIYTPMRLIIINSQKVLCDSCYPFWMQKEFLLHLFELLLIKLSAYRFFRFSILIDFRFDIVIVNLELQVFFVPNSICDNLVMKLLSKNLLCCFSR